MEGFPRRGPLNGCKRSRAPTAEQRQQMADFLATVQSEAATAKRVGVSRAAVRHFKKTRGKAVPPDPPPFFHPEEEKLLVSFVRTKALLGQGLTRDGFLTCCGEYIAALSLNRQQIARRYFNGKLTPGRGFYCLFLNRWPQLTEYRVGTLVDSRAQNARPHVVAG